VVVVAVVVVVVVVVVVTWTIELTPSPHSYQLIMYLHKMSARNFLLFCLLVEFLLLSVSMMSPAVIHPFDQNDIACDS